MSAKVHEWVAWAIALVVLSGVAEAQRVPIRVAEPSGVSRQIWPVTSGIPFPQGMLRDPDLVRLVDEDGKERPLQTRVLARWLDGTVRWLLLDFQVELKANDTYRGWIEVGQARSAVPRPIQTKNEPDGGLTVDTGAISVTFDPEGKAKLLTRQGPLLAPFCESKIELIKFPTLEVEFGPSLGEYLFKIDKGELVIEESGPIRVVVRLKGWHYTSEGKRVSPSVIRFELYRGLGVVRVMHTFVMSENPNEVMVRRIQLDSALAEAKEVTCALGAETPAETKLGSNEAAYLLQKDVGELHYPHLNQGEPFCEAVRDTGVKTVLSTGKKSQGWLRISAGNTAATFALPHMRENWPKELRAQGDGKVIVGLWPPDYEPWDMRRVEIRLPKFFLEYLQDEREAQHWRGYMAGASMLEVSAMGLARTHDIYCSVSVPGLPELSGADLVRAAEKPLYAYATPQWFCDSKAFGRMWPYDPERFPKEETYLERWLTWLLEQQEKWKWYGILDFGDVQYVVRSPAQSKWPKDDRWWRHSGKYGWFNSGHSEQGGPLLQGLCLQYARTGDRRYLDFAMIRGRHKMDVDTIHYYPEPETWRVGGMRRHSGFDHFTGAANPQGAHTLINGLPELYFLTGYQRAADVALMVTDAKMAKDQSFSPTRSGITDWNAYILAYQMTHDPKYLERIKKYLVTHAERQKQPSWPLLWFSYFIAPARTLMTCLDQETQDLCRQVYLQEYAAIGSLGGPGEVALAYELAPTRYHYHLLTKIPQHDPAKFNPVIMNQAGIINVLPHLMWALMDARKRFGDPPTPKTPPPSLAKGMHYAPVDISIIANRNPWSVNIFEEGSPDTTVVPASVTGAEGVWRFDFGPLKFWDPNSIPVTPTTIYPTRVDSPKVSPTNLADCPFGTEWTADGVKFSLLSPPAHGGKAILILENRQEYTLSLPPDTRTLHFLGHVTSRVELSSEPGFEYEFILADGTTQKLPLLYGEDYHSFSSAQGALNVRPVPGRRGMRLNRYAYHSTGPAIRSLRMRDLGKGAQLLVVAITAEVPESSKPASPSKPSAPEPPPTLVYGLKGGSVTAQSQIDPTNTETFNLAAIEQTLPDWKTNLLLTDWIGVLESLEPRHFLADLPNGEYEVSLYLARMYPRCKNMFYVKVQGKQVLEKVTTSVGVEPPRKFRVEVTDGKFDLEIGFAPEDFEKNSNWAIRAIELRKLR